MTVAALGLAVDSSQVVQATPALQKMAAASRTAENAAVALAKAEHTKAAAALSAARAAGTATKEELAAAAASVRQSRTAYDAARALRDAAAAAERQAVAVGGSAAASRVHASALQAEAAAMRMANFQRTNLIFQLNDIGVSLASGMNPLLVAIQQGSQIATIYGPGEGGIGRAISESGRLIGGVLAKFAPIGIAIGTVAAGFAGLTYEINKTAKTQVDFGDVFVATVQLAAESIGNLLRPAVQQVGTWFTQLWDFIAPTLKGIGNGIVGAFVGAFDGVKATWTLFPAAIGDLVIQGVNGVIGAVEGMINGVSRTINGFIEQVNAAIQMIPEDLRGGWTGLGTIGDVSFGRVDNPNAGAAGKVASGIGSAFSDAMSTDWMGMAGDAISGRAQTLELEQLAEAAEKAAKGMKAANDNGRAFEQMLSDVSPLLHDANDPLAELQSNMDKLGALLAAGEISWEQYGAAVERANLNAAAGVLGAVGQITSTLAGAFENNKAFAVANAVVNTAEGVTKALAQGGMFAFPMAAAIAAAGAAQIASILSAKPGSSAAASTSSGGAAAQQGVAPVAPAEARTINVVMPAGQRLFSHSQLEQLIRELNDKAGDGLTIQAA